MTIVTGPAGAPRGILKQAELAVRHEDGFTVYEAAIPWSVLEPIVPAAGTRFGFDILINNFENGARYTLGWAGGIAHGKYPGLFVPVVLR